MADFLRQEYTRERKEIDEYWVVVRNPETGEVDISRPYSPLTPPRKHRSKSKVAQLKNEQRRRKFRKSRDIEKSPKIPIVSQQVTKTKVGG